MFEVVVLELALIELAQLFLLSVIKQYFQRYTIMTSHCWPCNDPPKKRSVVAWDIVIQPENLVMKLPQIHGIHHFPCQFGVPLADGTQGHCSWSENHITWEKNGENIPWMEEILKLIGGLSHSVIGFQPSKASR